MSQGNDNNLSGPATGTGNGNVSSWIKDAPRPVVTVAGGLMVLGVLAIFWVFRSPITSGVQEARAILAVIFSIATIVLAFSLLFGVLLTPDDTQGVKERFAMGNQVLSPIIGIMGTILGFYFGTADQASPRQPLAIVDVDSDTRAIAGTSVPITVLVQGGVSPWTYTLDFGTTLPTVEHRSNQSYLREMLPLPKDKFSESKSVGLTVTVTDGTGVSTTWTRPAGEWLTVDPVKRSEVKPSEVSVPPQADDNT